MSKPKGKAAGWFLAILVSGVIGVATYNFYPTFTRWFIFESNDALGMLLILAILIVSFIPPFIPAGIASAFDVNKNKVLAVICALLMGLPITIQQAANWNIYTSAPVTGSWIVEGGNGWTALFCIICPGIVFILMTFFLMAFAAAGKTAAIKTPKAPCSLVPEFIKRGRKYLVWSIINTVFLFIFVLPILAIIQSDKARKAQDKATHDRHIKRALFLNIATYPLFILFGTLAEVLY